MVRRPVVLDGLAGRLFVALGLVTIGLAIIGPDPILLLAVLGVGTLALIAALVYSHVVWRTDPDRRTL